jgi:hypothetical protein
MQITEEVDTKPNARQIDSLNQYRLLTKLSAQSIMCTALVSVITEHFELGTVSSETLGLS